jgi:hypothetical protein
MPTTLEEPTKAKQLGTIHWVHGPHVVKNGRSRPIVDEGADYCHECAGIVAKEYQKKFPAHADEIILDGGYEPYRQSDSPAYCQRCNMELSCCVIGLEGNLHIVVDTLADWNKVGALCE